MPLLWVQCPGISDRDRVPGNQPGDVHAVALEPVIFPAGGQDQTVRLRFQAVQRPRREETWEREVETVET